MENVSDDKKREVAALLAILLGGLGIHYFYCGKATAGVLSIVLSLCTCGIWPIITFVQGILILLMNDEQFKQKYVLSDSTFPVF